MPENAILVSPFVDLASKFDGRGEGEDEEGKLMDLDFMNNAMLGMVGYQYCENRPELRRTLLSPARGNLPDGYTYEGLCRSMVVWGDAEAFGPGMFSLGTSASPVTNDDAKACRSSSIICEMQMSRWKR